MKYSMIYCIWYSNQIKGFYHSIFTFFSINITNNFKMWGDVIIVHVIIPKNSPKRHLHHLLKTQITKVATKPLTINIFAGYFLAALLSCFLMMSMRLLLVPMTSSSSPWLLLCLALLCCSNRWGELRSCGGSMEPVGFTRFTMSRNSRLLLLFMKVMAVPLWPSLPARPI